MEQSKINVIMKSAHDLHAFFSDLLVKHPKFSGEVKVKLEDGNIVHVEKNESVKF